MWNRVSLTDFAIVLLVYLESVCSLVLRVIPRPVINLFSGIISLTAGSGETTFEEKLRCAPTIHEMCALFDIVVEDHLVRTEDNYILTLHRIPPQPHNSNGKAVYLHHGLLMCSDVWVCQLDRAKNLPFVLHDLGYDVWMGNNRGNKYSTGHLYFPPKSAKFWDFSIDEFAFFDIPNSIQFVLDYCQVEQLICIGFSQGSAQMFAAFSLNEDLNRKVSHLIAVAPAMAPKRLHNVIADAFAKSSPALLYLFFGRNIILPSAVVWQRTLHPGLYSVLIDLCNRILFNWRSLNILPAQKAICFAKLYSTTSVKTVVHWFQILRSQKFQMFEESDDVFNSLSRPYQIATFPTRTNIKIPILLIYGSADLLIDIKVMKKNLPPTSVFDVKVDEHEHLDLLWGEHADTLVISKVIKFIEFFDIVADTNETHDTLLLTNQGTPQEQAPPSMMRRSNSIFSAEKLQSVTGLTPSRTALNRIESVPELQHTASGTTRSAVHSDDEDDAASIDSIDELDSIAEGDEPAGELAPGTIPIDNDDDDDTMVAYLKKNSQVYTENKIQQRDFSRYISHEEPTK
ncbi:sterol esterase KNAG_0A06130 [Huiozyma naganishii CBS 8797]|uniref:AB hydrolase-1 domain-containing protein n=1 Tax=Huiozyma naganishii (strain ATCC MYA-139 / BCRC 22969 / CBS 8797 / KCTC 17520 / NBRC 10181 / NCYC 3082 / Yp74L-3) TaxID=1071383 RepID=J7R0E7_HUIN7|nr:hypothetical protein KNAG_0A06130 [Kazachstania naganishii CBS 8797]CCK68275.1 hypothetical protein KNAG_0A06130 [Kazachstania naganishii CBS 8797]